jgi:hypothetical protein
VFCNIYARFLIFKDLKDVMELDFDVRGYPDDFGSRQALVLKPTIQTTLLQAYRLLFNDPNTADIQFVCTSSSGKEPKYVYAHSAILSHLSEYFKTSEICLWLWSLELSVFGSVRFWIFGGPS